MKYLFIDESGDHNLDPKKIDPTFPLFVLTGVVIDVKEHLKFRNNLRTVKKTIFGSNKILLHSLELTRTDKAKQSKVRLLAHPDIRKLFYQQINELIDQTKFKLIVFVIKKKELNNLFKDTVIDPYFFGLSFIVEEFVKSLNGNEKGKIVLEKRGKLLDRQLLLAWEANKNNIIKNIQIPKLSSKTIVWSGLELADLISFRISRMFNNKPSKPVGNELSLKILKNKLTKWRVFPLKNGDPLQQFSVS